MRSHLTRRFFLLIALVLCFVVAEQSRAETAEDLFHSGVSSYQKNDLDHAREQFTQALKLSPNNIEVLYNLGLVEYKAKHEGLALGLWRKALALSPSDDQVSYAIQYAEKNQQQRPLSRGGDVFENLHRSFLVSTSLMSLVVLNLILFAFAGWILIRYFAARSRSLENEEPSPPIPYIGYLFAALFVVALFLLGSKIFDLSLIRATVVEQKVEVKTSPDASAATLFELFEGVEVVVRQSRGEWAQVTYPGSLTGWVPANSVFVTSGR